MSRDRQMLLAITLAQTVVHDIMPTSFMYDRPTRVLVQP